MRKLRNIHLLISVALIFFCNTTIAQIQTLKLPQEATAVSFSPDGEYVAGSTGLSNKQEMVFLWEINGALVRTFEAGISSLHTINNFVFSPDGKYILVMIAWRWEGSLGRWKHPEVQPTLSFWMPAGIIHSKEDGQGGALKPRDWHL
jgi:WD40 repeat protein